MCADLCEARLNYGLKTNKLYHRIVYVQIEKESARQRERLMWSEVRVVECGAKYEQERVYKGYYTPEIFRGRLFFSRLCIFLRV